MFSLPNFVIEKGAKFYVIKENGTNLTKKNILSQDIMFLFSLVAYCSVK